MRIGAFDGGDITVDNSDLDGHTTITMDKSSSNNTACSTGAAYTIQPAIGSSGTANFLLTNSRQYRTVTLAIVPNPQTVNLGIIP